MEFGKRFARASAITATVALATIVGTASADRGRRGARRSAAAAGESAAAAAPRRRCRRSSTAWRRPCSRRPRRTGSTTSCGSSRRRHRRRRQEGPHPRRRLAPARDRHRRPQGPGHLRGQPVLRGRRRRRQLGRRPRARPAAGRAHPRAPYFTRRATRARRSARIYEATWVPRGFAVVHAESPGTRPLRRLPELRRADRDARRHRGHRLAQRPRARATRPRPAPTRSPRPPGTTATTAMMGTSYNGTIPIAAATDRRRGPEGDRPDLRDLRLVRLLPRQRPRPRAALGPGGQNGTTAPGEDLDVLDRVHRTRATTKGRTAHDLLADDRRRSTASQDRVTGNRSAFWDERNYMKDARQDQGRDAARARQQRLQRHDQERRAATTTCSRSNNVAAPVLLPPGRPRRRAAGLPAQPAGSRSTCGARTTASRTCRSPGSCARPTRARRASRRVVGEVVNTDDAHRRRRARRSASATR